MVKPIILSIAAWILFAALPAQAEWSKAFELDYLMGDGDNRSSARQAALEQVKRKASDEAGTYVQSTTTLHEGGDLTESIQMISASMVRLDKVQERLSVNASGQAVLWIKAVATLDDSELARRVAMLQEDKEKARQVKLLQSENETLRQDLARIRIALAAKSDPTRNAELLTQQDSTIKRMVDNGRTITQVFERGTLLQLASRDTDAFAKAKRDLDEHFFAPLMQSAVSATIESVVATEKGYDAMVRVGWTIDIKRLYPVLVRYLNVHEYGGNITVFASRNLENQGPNILSERIYRHLAQKGVDLQLRLAGKQVRLPVFYTDDAFMDACGTIGGARDGEAKYLCLVSQNAALPDIHGTSFDTSNPIRIHLTREEAERANRVEAVLVMF